jgi:hypothetical protein
MRLGISIRDQINLFLVAAFVLFLTACQGGEENGTASVRLSLDLFSSKTGAAKTSSAPAPAEIRSIRIDVTGPGMEPLSESVEVNSEGETVVNLEISAGAARRFVVIAFDVEAVERFRGEATIDLAPGTSPTIRIVMVAINVEPPPILIDPPTVILTRSEPEDPRTATFTLTNATTAEVSLQVNSNPGGTFELGQVTPSENPNAFIYTAPETIPIDRTQTQIGVPIPITIEAVDTADPNRRGQATVKMVTEPRLLFGPNVPVSERAGFISTESSGQRSVAYHNGKVFSVWANCPDGCLEILFSETSDGIQWTRPLIIATDDNIATPSLAIGPDGSIYVVYVACSFCQSPSPTIKLIVRRPGQDTFESLPLTMVGPSAQDPAVAVSPNGIAFVAWSDRDPNTRAGRNIYLQRVPIDTAPRPINSNQGGFDHTGPAISISDSGEVFLAWEVSGFINDNFFQNITATASTDGGVTFLPAVQVDDPTENPFDFTSSPTVAAGPQGTFYVAWEFDRCGDGCTIVYSAKGTLDADGLLFSQIHPFGDIETGPDQESPSIASDGANGIYVVFREQSNGDQVVLAKSVDEGATFLISPVSFADNNASQFSPSVAVDSAGRAFVIWTDGRRSLQGLNDVFFSMGDDPSLFIFDSSFTSFQSAVPR